MAWGNRYSTGAARHCRSAAGSMPSRCPEQATQARGRGVTIFPLGRDQPSAGAKSVQRASATHLGRCEPGSGRGPNRRRAARPIPRDRCCGLVGGSSGGPVGPSPRSVSLSSVSRTSRSGLSVRSCKAGGGRLGGVGQGTTRRWPRPMVSTGFRRSTLDGRVARLPRSPPLQPARTRPCGRTALAWSVTGPPQLHLHDMAPAAKLRL